MMEVIIVIYEINLHSCRLNRCYFDDKRMIRVIYDNIHPGKTDYLVKLITPLVDNTPPRHECSDFTTVFLHRLRYAATT